MKKNYYNILEIKSDATSREVKNVYRRLARRFHPDMNPGNREAEERFKEIAEAYTQLSDENRRKQHDFYLGQPNSLSTVGGSSYFAVSWWEFALAFVLASTIAVTLIFLATISGHST